MHVAFAHISIINTTMKRTVSRILISAPAQKVWTALTKPELVNLWQYGSELTTSWEVGTPIRFRTEWEGQVFVQWGTVEEFIDAQRLVYTLFAPRPGLEDRPENYFTMQYLLSEEEGQTQLEIVQLDPRADEDDADLAEGQEEESEDAEDNPVLVMLKLVCEQP